MRIGSGLSGIDLLTQHNLLAALNSLSLSSVRLSTMRRINAGSDDPAGLIAAENLRAELTAIQQASENTARADGAVAVADAAMSEVSDLLATVRGNVVAAAGGLLTDGEIEALQIETDAALAAINRIGNTSCYGGQKLLDGSAAEGLRFVFSPDPQTVSTLALPQISTRTLGGPAGTLSDLASGGSASLAGGNLELAMEILDSASGQVLAARAEAGAFQRYTADSARQVLDHAEVSISSALSQLLDTDVAEETSRMIRAEILADAATACAAIAGQSRGLVSRLFDGLQ